MLYSPERPLSSVLQQQESRAQSSTRLESVDEFVQKMEDEDLKEIEDVWEKRFYRDELKASLYLINSLLDAITQSQSPRSSQPVHPLAAQSVFYQAENEPNKLNVTTKPRNLKALNRTISHQTISSTRQIEHFLASCQEENQYLRVQLLRASEKLEYKKDQVSHLTNEKQDTQQLMEKMKKKILELETRMTEQRVQLKEVSQVEEKLLELRGLRDQFLQLQKQLSAKGGELEECRVRLKEAREFIQSQQVSQAQKADLQGELETVRKQLKAWNDLQNRQCANCLKLKNLNQHLSDELSREKVRLSAMRQQFEKTLNFEQAQRREWQAFLNQLES